MVIPVLMLSFVNDVWLGFVLNISTVLCFTGLHEVAREIESPYQNVPNDVPLNNFQAQFNEGLMVMFFAYHPDAYWDVEETLDEIRNLQDGGKSNESESDSAKKESSGNIMTKKDNKSSNPGTIKPPPVDNVADKPLKEDVDMPESIESIETVLSNGGKSVIPIQRNEEFAAKAEEERDEYDKVGGNTRTFSREKLDMIEAKERQERLEELQKEQEERQQQQEANESSSSRSDDRLQHQQQVSFMIPTEDENSSLVFTAGSARDSQSRISGSSEDFDQEEPTIT